MADERSVNLRPITSVDVERVAQFLHRELNTRVSSRAWAAAIITPWQIDSSNHGYLLECDEQVVGAHLAFYSDRIIDGEHYRVCNLGAWCVMEEFRSHGLRLLRALLSQRGFTFTDLSPSGNVIALNRRLKFQDLDTTTLLAPNLPWPPSRHIQISADPDVISSTLRGRDLQIYRDHERAAAALHLVIRRDESYSYLILRKDRRKNLPIFASVLYVSGSALFAQTARHVFSHLLLKHGILATLAELRVVKERPLAATMVRSGRAKMFKSDQLRSEQIDYLYSELEVVAW